MKYHIEDVQIAQLGLLHLIACAPKEMPVKEVATAANALHPTGSSTRWQSPEEHTEDTAPVACDDHPETRIHHLFIC